MLNIWDIQRISNQWLIMVTDTSEVSAWYLYIHWLAYTIISSLVRNKEVPHWPYWSCCNTSTGSSCYNPEIFSCFQITFITSWLEILNSMWIFHCKLQIHKKYFGFIIGINRMVNIMLSATNNSAVKRSIFYFPFK